MAMQNSGGGIGIGGVSSWMQNNLHWLDDDDEQDSDTDSKLSGSAAADSVMRHLARSRQPYKPGGNEFSLKEQDEDEGEEVSHEARASQHASTTAAGTSTTGHLSNGYHHSHHHHQHQLYHQHQHQQQDSAARSPQMQRRQNLTASSPKFQHRQRLNYENTQMGGAYENTQMGGAYLYANRKNEMLSPVPESTMGGGARVVEMLPPAPFGSPHGPRKWSVGAAGTRSMENVSTGTPPSRRRNYEQQLPNGRPHYRDVHIPQSNEETSRNHSRSHELLPQLAPAEIMGVAYREQGSDEVHSEVNLGGYHRQQPPSYSHYRKTSIGNTNGGVPALSVPHSHSHSHSNSYSGRNSSPNLNKHYRSVSISSGSSVPAPANYHQSPPRPTAAPAGQVTQTWLSDPQANLDSRKTPPQRRANYVRHELLRDGPHLQGSLHEQMNHFSRGAGQGEPNLKDVIKFLQSDDKMLVSNAASYLQHLAYGDDTMKTKIREHGAIPVLVNLIRHQDTRVQITALGALKNLSYGRVTDENKHMILKDHGLMEIMVALKNSRVSEVRELLTALLWNLSSCEELKLKMIKGCLHDLVEMVMVPYSGWNTQESREPTARPQALHWNAELKNTTGTLRNMSSAGESARSFMRSTNGMVDTLLWLLKAGVQQKSAADEKTVENTVCILRNLSYRLENEVDPQEGGEDILDREWEQEQRREVEDLNRSFSKPSSGCLSFCVRPKTHDDAPRVALTAVNRPVFNVDFVYPDASVMPKRRKPVYGKCLLWQPEVVFVYLAVVEQYPDSVETIEAAAGAIQNLTACNWKWSVYIRNIVRTSNGLHLIAELLNNGHDLVVRAAATALRNVAIDQRNKSILGAQSIANIIPRLPLSTNHLGISEDTSVALLCCLMELFSNCPENAKLFHEKEGVLLLTRLARSRQHTVKVTFAAHKVCSLLWDYKDYRSVLRKLGWEISHFNHAAKDSKVAQFEFDIQGSISRDYQGSRRKKRDSKRSSKRSGKKKDKDGGPGSGIGFIAGGLPLGEMADVPMQNPSSAMSVGTGTISPSLTSPSSVNPSSVNPSMLLEDPNYQTIPSPSSGHHHHHQQQQQQQQQQQSPALIEPSYQSVPAASSQHNQSPPMIEPNYASVPTTSPDPTPSSTNPPAPTIIYQSINDPDMKSGVQASATTVETSAIASTTSGPVSVTSLEEEVEPDPNATYACVDIEKKRASRRKKKEQEKQEQQQQQSQEQGEAIDSWV